MMKKLLSLLAISGSLALAGADSSFADVATGDSPVVYPTLNVQPFVSSQPCGYTPTQIRHAYGIDLSAYNGEGETIAIVIAWGCPHAQADLAVFSQTFGLPAADLQVVYAGRVPNSSDTGWALEASLDLQWAHAVAPKAKLILVVAASDSAIDMANAVTVAANTGASVVSMSWGGLEWPEMMNYESSFVNSAVSFVAASGDNGAGVMWPASSPNVLAVGGTTLVLDANGNLLSPESAWAGSGGGASAYYARPTYQAAWQSSSQRQIPDVALIGNPWTGVAVYDSNGFFGGAGWGQVGGTSAGTPMWSAILAMANQRRHAKGLASLSSAACLSYKLASMRVGSSGSLYSTYFFDVTSGSNGFSATAKFDEVTGLGTPLVPNVVLRIGQ